MKSVLTFLVSLSIVLVIAIIGLSVYVDYKADLVVVNTQMFAAPITANYISEKSESTVATTTLFINTTYESQGILSSNFELLGVATTTTFKEVLDIANQVSERVKIRPAFLLAIFQEELELEKFDMCYLTDIKTGAGVRVIDGQPRKKTLKPDRDLVPFLAITKELGKDPLKTQITCPMSFGWGGAMGPADFIPSTWMMYRKQIEKITNKPADPWDINDAFLAAGLFLSDAGAKSKTYKGEWRAAMIYFSGSPNSKYHFYADGALKIAEKIQQDIDSINVKPE